jgi:aryl-alcohol dehydrogenase-like predicted oxidoreductase
LIEKKLVIGTAQFGMNYGISNKTGMVTPTEAKKILSYSYDKGIRTLDTAKDYGESESTLGMLGVSEFNVISKFILKNNTKLNLLLDDSLNKLRIDRLYGYLAHRPQQVFKNPDLWEKLTIFKKEKKILNIGFSINEISEAKKIIELNMKPDLVQLPFNLFDNRFQRYIDHFQKCGTMVYSRSTFLQGMFFIEPNNLKGKIKCFGIPLKILKSISSSEGIEIADLALNYSMKKNEIEKVLIGIENFDQFKKNVDSLDRKIPENIYDSLKKIQIKDESLLNPSNW